MSNLAHPGREAALPLVVSVTVQVSVEQDEVDVSLKQVQAALLHFLLVVCCLLLHLNTHNVNSCTKRHRLTTRDHGF